MFDTGWIGSIVERSSTATWVYDFDSHRVVWANQAAQKIWAAESAEELYARDMSLDMSISVEQRLSGFREELSDPECRIKEVWTVHPAGQPVMLTIAFSGIILPDGRLAMLCEGHRSEAHEVEAARAAQTLLHTGVEISLVSKDGALLYANPAAREARCSASQPLTQRFVNPRESAGFQAALERDGAHRTVARLTSRAGERWYEINASLCRDAATGTEAYLVTELDVTEMKEAETRAEAADHAKSRFLANMSHELRTPLNAIIGFSELILGSNSSNGSPEKMREYAADINNSGQHLLNLINDILDLAKVDTGALKVNLRDYPITETINPLRVMANDALTRGIDLTVLPVSDALIVHTDPVRLRQILVKLIDNAVKFTEAEGHATVRVVEQDATIAIIVSDDGIGMAPDDMEDALEPFRQIDSAVSRQFEGSGLGLPLSQRLVKELGGTFDIVSEVGVGTRVTVRLPTAEVRAMPLAQAG